MDSSLASQGLQIMALAGLISGQMFNFMVGFGLSALLKSIRFKSNLFKLFDWNRKSYSSNYMFMATFGGILLNLVYLYLKMVKINK